jgi:FkbM family methyltransferase
MKSSFKSIYNKIPFKKNLFLFLRRFDFPEKIFRHLYFEDVFEVEFKPYKFLIQHYGFQLENEIFWKGLTSGWEKISIQLWIELSKKSDSILDIGANTGIYSLISKAVNPNSSVYAFEPVNRVFDKLYSNVNLNNYPIKCYNYALSNKDGEAVFYDTMTPHIYSVAINKNISGIKDVVSVKVETKRLSTFIEKENIKKIDLIKIDVETHEPEVLEGMEEYLALFKPTLLIEILNDEIGNKIQELIKNIDYLYFNIDEIGLPQRVAKIEKSKYYNYLICSEDIARQLNLIEK